MEINEILKTIDNMSNISNIEITIEGVTIKVEKVNTTTATPKNIQSFVPPASFANAKDFVPNNKPDHLASTNQVKFATDLAEKLSPGNPNNVVNFLAHALELPLEEIPTPGTWEETMTKEMAGEYLDILDSEHKKMRKRGGFQ